MFKKYQTPSTCPREGELYKVIKLHGATFEIRYGYYEEIDRAGPPVAIYPDFGENPAYTPEGYPFVTYMQDACPHHRARGPVSEPDCGSCQHLERGEALIGICRCPQKKCSQQGDAAI